MWGGLRGYPHLMGVEEVGHSMVVKPREERILTSYDSLYETGAREKAGLPSDEGRSPALEGIAGGTVGVSPMGRGRGRGRGVGRGAPLEPM